MIKIIIAVDFDGVIVTENFPQIGRPHIGVINALIERKKKGDKLILWTCRCGQQLTDAVAFCRNMGLEFDAVNENLQMMIDKYGSDSRKVYADCYIDDRNKDADWLLFRARTERNTPQLQEPVPRKTARIVRR